MVSAAISHIDGLHIDYVHQSYSKLSFMKTYQFIVEPIPGAVEWPIVSGDSVLPPFFRRQPGRPKKKRQRLVHEPKNPNAKRRGGSVKHCGRCGGEGHNQRKCQMDVADEKAMAAAKANSDRVARFRTKQKEARTTGLNAQAKTSNRQSAREENGLVKKAKVKRKGKEANSASMRDSQEITGPSVRG